jgi:cellulose synthase/poly-beta-1,6-N-acetylglucosamine synthase-like glycosyltransferase
MTGELANDVRRPFPSPAMSEVSADTAMPGDPADWETVPVLSVIIPVYNEVHTIGRILIEVAKPLPEVPKQIVIVDDRSSDGTSDWLRKNLGQSEGSWRRLSLSTSGGLELSADGPLNHGGISVADYSATSPHAFLAANLAPGTTAKTDGLVRISRRRRPHPRAPCRR